ncbi:MAG TPA: iron-containing alcohol dehydrogenase [Opitutaceae bacterium]
MTFPSLRPLTLLQPPRIAFGAGCALDCADELARRGLRHPAIIVSSPRAAAQASPLGTALKARGLNPTLLAGVPAEPDIAAFERLRTRLRALPCDSIIGLGGGSVLDVAKLLAALHGRDEPVSTFFGIGRLSSRSLYLACLPTTAGTGSEVSPNAILLDEAARLKKGVISPWLVPDAAFIDPALMLSAPPELTAATGIDALVHCIEAYANRHAHPMVDLYALQGIRLIAENLPRAVATGDDLAARSAVALGSLYGGLCLGPVNTAAVHALAYPLGGEFHLAHGLANALLVTAVLRFNLPAAPERYAEIARALGAREGENTLATAGAGLARLAALCRACNLPRGLADCGVPAGAIPRLAASAMTVTRLLQNNPREMTTADAERIYQEAL